MSYQPDDLYRFDAVQYAQDVGNYDDLFDADRGDERWCDALPISVHLAADRYWAELYCLLMGEQDATRYMNIAAEMSEVCRLYGLASS